MQHVFFLSLQRQYHSQIDNLIEETVKEMITLLVAKVEKECSLLVFVGKFISLLKSTHNTKTDKLKTPQEKQTKWIKQVKEMWNKYQETQNTISKTTKKGNQQNYIK